MAITVSCAGCNIRLTLGDERAGSTFECPRCEAPIAIPAPPTAPPPTPTPPRRAPAPPAAPSPPPVPKRRAPAPPVPSPVEDDDSGPDVGSDDAEPDGDETPRGRRQPHSGLGVASFVIAVVVGGLDALLGLVVVLNVAGARGAPEVQDRAFGGAVALVCLNCLSIPVCLVGVGLAVAALVAHPGRRHVLTYIGLAVNALVLLTILGLYVLGSMSKGEQPERFGMAPKGAPVVAAESRAASQPTG